MRLNLLGRSLLYTCPAPFTYEMTSPTHFLLSYGLGVAKYIPPTIDHCYYTLYMMYYHKITLLPYIWCNSNNTNNNTCTAGRILEELLNLLGRQHILLLLLLLIIIIIMIISILIMIIIVIWGNTNRVVSKGPLYDSNTKTVTLLMFAGWNIQAQSNYRCIFLGPVLPPIRKSGFWEQPRLIRPRVYSSESW